MTCTEQSVRAATPAAQPLTEYKTEAFHLFEAMLLRLNTVVTSLAMRVGIVPS
jgi:preprotein translocase subunit SecA